MGNILKNVMETLVFNKLDSIIDAFDCCKCPKCRLDIAAYALNILPNKYVVTSEGELYSRLDTLNLQFETDITTAILIAAKKINENPLH